ncbi:MAG TPA: cupin domain-containing protein [Alphaproteobacteria bacterium]|nr:cupin domain-containing protein [Alphaproteobacteria bacterium]
MGDSEEEEAEMTSPARPGETAPLESFRLADDGHIPNNAALPLVVYRNVLPLDGADPAAACEALFAENDWNGGWRDGIYPYHHYHATTHEALGIVRGEARVRFGGEAGPVVTVRAGDVVVIPAGVGHKSEGATGDLLVVGAYPGGREPDMCTGRGDTRLRALASIAHVPLPAADPVYGVKGPLLGAWRLGHP